jgi:hypothetical protein
MAANEKTLTKLEWVPQVFIATITNDGVVEHPDPACRDVPVFLAAEIPSAIFFRQAVYFPSATHKRDFIDTMYRWTATSIFLVTDGNDGEIYCIAFGPPFNIPMLFGKLSKECDVYNACVEVFGNV